MMKLKKLLTEEFNYTKKFIGEKNAKLAMVYKVKQRKEQLEEVSSKVEETKELVEKKSGILNSLVTPFQKLNLEEKISARGVDEGMI